MKKMLMLTGKICQVCDANDGYMLRRNKERKRFLLYISWDAHVEITQLTHETTTRITYMKLKYVGKITPHGNSINPLEERLNRIKE